MEPLGIRRLYWKEFRTQSVIWLSVFAMGLVFAIPVLSLVDIDSVPLTASAILFIAPALFGLASGAFAFAGESEAGTVGMLRQLPVDSGSVLRTKFGFGLAGIVLFVLAFGMILWPTTYQVRRIPLGMPGPLSFALWSIETLIWSTFFALRLRSVFPAIAWGSIAVFASIVLLPWYGRIPVVILIALRLFPQAEQWFSSYSTAAQRGMLSRLQERLTRLPRDAGRIAWLLWRENRLLISAAIVALIFAFAGTLFFIGNAAWWYELTRFTDNFETRRNWRAQQPPFPLVEYFGPAMIVALISGLLFSSLGLVAFGTFRQQRNARLLTEQGISARLVVLVRTVFLVLLLYGIWTLTQIAFTAYEIGLGQRKPNTNWDGSYLITLFAILPCWCFVATYWSSFHSSQKVVAYIAGLMLGLLAAGLHFICWTLSIAPRIGSYSLFVWLGLSALLYPIAFASSWGLRRWRFSTRLALWSLFPLALIGIYGGTAIWRTYDVPEHSRMDMTIPIPTDVPRIEIIKPAELTSSPEPSYGLRNPAFRALFRTEKPAGPIVNDWIFERWTITEPGSLKWQAEELDSAETIHQVFREREATVRWARDKMNAADCLVDAGSDLASWFQVGAYSALKGGEPDESLAYIRAIFRGATNLVRRRFHECVESVDKYEWNDDWEFRFSTRQALELLVVWARHPSVKGRHDLVRQAIELLPDPAAHREMNLAFIAFRRDWLRSQYIDNEQKLALTRPLDYRTQLLCRIHAPWEQARRLQLIDFSAALDYQWQVSDSTNERYEIERLAKRYRAATPQGTFWDFEGERKVNELRSQLEKLLEDSESPKDPAVDSAN